MPPPHNLGAPPAQDAAYSPRRLAALFNRLPVIMAAYPLAWLALLYAFVVRARLQLGHWPSPYQPDPKDLGFTFHHQSIWFGLMALPAIALATVAISIVGRRRTVYHRNWPALTLLAVSVGSVVALGRLDPGDFFEWFAD